MKKRFLIRVFISAVVLFLLAGGMDFVICQGLLKMEDYRFQDYAAMLEGGMDHDLLVMGNSRGKSHYDLRILDSLLHTDSFCIGIGGYPFNVQLLKYNLYREHNRKPKVIVQDIDPATVFNLFPDVRHQHQSEQFFPLVYDREMRRELKRVGYGSGDLNLPMYRFFGYQQVIKNGLLEALHLKHYVSSPAYKGHRPEDGKWDGTELRKKKIEEIVMDESRKAMFEAYLNRCKEDSIQVVLVYSPMYFEAREKMKGLDSARACFSEMARRYGCIYLDYLDDPICRDSANFCVSVHMNPGATAAFARRLGRDLDSLRLPALNAVKEE
ncbi:MAG: hypothetical protein IKW89_13665 [Bacteroidales bacterium]|nr:hypothetical protein [Bacteroidales bacterium]